MIFSLKVDFHLLFADDIVIGVTTTGMLKVWNLSSSGKKVKKNLTYCRNFVAMMEVQKCTVMLTGIHIMCNALILSISNTHCLIDVSA